MRWNYQIDYVKEKNYFIISLILLSSLESAVSKNEVTGYNENSKGIKIFLCTDLA